LIVAAGDANGAFGLARYDSSGTLDPAFSGNGKLTTDLSAGEDGAMAVAIQADGKIVAVGHANYARFAVVRYDTDGTPDATFGGDGVVKTSFTPGSDIAYGVAIQPDGKILVAGSASLADGSAFALARYDTEGLFDTTFGGDGNRSGPLRAVAARSNGTARSAA
jgi:uncharacterized delta-60 repeat protein